MKRIVLAVTLLLSLLVTSASASGKHSFVPTWTTAQELSSEAWAAQPERLAACLLTDAGIDIDEVDLSNVWVLNGAGAMCAVCADEKSAIALFWVPSTGKAMLERLSGGAEQCEAYAAQLLKDSAEYNSCVQTDPVELDRWADDAAEIG